MIEDGAGQRRLIAPRREVADFVAATYTFDTVEVAPVGVTATRREWAISAGPLHVAFEIGRRTPLGWLLRAVPPPLTRSRTWIRITDWPARRLVPGVRTVGSAGAGRREYYGARDLHPITASVAWLDGRDLGPLAKIDPPVRFGFGSVPPRPALVRVTTTVDGDF
jgi:hypothetical protein